MTMIALIIALAAGSSAAAQDVAPPAIRPIERVMPVYPAYAVGLGVNAVCLGQFEIGAGGVPADLCVRCSTSLPASSPSAERTAASFAHASETAIAQWRYDEDHIGTRMTDVRLSFLLPDEPDVEIPDPPAMGECPGHEAS